MQRQKWRLIKWCAGLLSLYLDKRLRKHRKHRPLDIVLIDLTVRVFVPRPHLKPFDASRKKNYEETTKHTVYWHGTGKLQHDKSGGTIDVLERMLAQNGLRPFKDIFDVKHGEMVSISVARQRMYARIYADMHVYKGARKRYGSPRFWAYYFIMAVNLHAMRELGLWSPRARRKQQSIWREQGKNLWIVKVTKQKGELSAQFFNDGSDISENYPILIGMKKADYRILKTAEYVARYEQRVGGPIPISAFTHLEVPKSKVAEVTALLKKHGHGDLPVFAFEQCEQLYSQKRFSELVS